MNLETFVAGHPAFNFIVYLNLCVVAWIVSLWVYEKITPYSEFKLIESGNKAAALSLGGVALGLALPLCSLAFNADGWAQMALWSAISLASQLILWLGLSRVVFKNLKQSIEGGVESVGMFLGVSCVAMGAMVAACVS